MRLTFRSLRSGWRLAIGAIRLPDALRRSRDVSGWRLISVDVFGTLIARKGGDDAAWYEGTLHAAEVARARGLVTGTDPITLRREVERRLSAEQIASGKDPEFSHRKVLEEMLLEWGAGPQAAAWAEELAAWELAREVEFTRPVAAVRRWVRARLAEGRRVVAASDTRYSANELRRLLSSHGIPTLSAIYTSADEAASKFSGRLFDRIAKREGATRARRLHVGDDLLADMLSPSERGLAVGRVRRLPGPASLPLAPEPVSAERLDPAYAMGYRTVGPVLVAFTRLLLQRARRDGVERLAFVARDGELLLRVARTLIGEKFEAPLALHYLHLSGQSLACASSDLQRLHTDAGAVERVVATLRDIRGMDTMLGSFQSLYNAPAELISRHAERLAAVKGTEADLRRLLSDAAAAADLADEFRSMTDRVRRYLVQEGVLCDRSALVDIGWRASLQKILQAEAPGWGLASPRGYYLGLWNEERAAFPPGANGLITDQRRGSGLREGSAWHAGFLLEAICRANHGMVAGYVEADDGRIEPTHMETGGTREAERQSAEVQARIQEGVLAYARWFAATYPLTVTDEAAIRRGAQRMLRRLAFFPSPQERKLGRQLIYSEPTSDGSALPLIADPGSGVGGRIAGLRSPWKGGYIRATAGILGSLLYCAAESTVARLPQGTKPAIRRMLIHE